MAERPPFPGRTGSRGGASIVTAARTTLSTCTPPTGGSCASRAPGCADPDRYDSGRTRPADLYQPLATRPDQVVHSGPSNAARSRDLVDPGIVVVRRSGW